MSQIIPALREAPPGRRHSLCLLLVLLITVGVGQACTSGDSGGDAEATEGARLTTSGAGDLLSSGSSASEPNDALSALRRPAPPPRPEQMTIDSLGVDFGRSDASVRMVEFYDFGCGYCRRFHQETRDLLHEQYVDPGRVFWKSVPFITGNWGPSVPISLAAECARDQGRSYFEEIVDVIFERQSDWKSSSDPEELAEEFAEAAGVDMERYRRCFENDEMLWRVQAHSDFAEDLGVTGTPTIYIVGAGPIVGSLPLEAFQQVIDTVLAIATAEQP